MKHFSLSFSNEKLKIIDQTKLPLSVKYLEIRNITQAVQAIKKLKVRGAPLIGVFAAYSLYISLKSPRLKSKKAFINQIYKNISRLEKSRPTAVNLSWALNRIKTEISRNKHKSNSKLLQIIKQQAQSMHQQDIELCDKIAKFGLKLIQPKDSLLTHCNTGFLATAGEGTALAIIYRAHKLFGNIKIYADETRPLLQGSRLTCWELLSRKIKVTLICDNTAACLMRNKKINKVIVGADRITQKGYVANKIGTYNLAVLCKYHRLDFYVAAPSSSFDFSIENPEEIPIEERGKNEVRIVFGKKIAPPKVDVYNPAFDITPPELITAIITEKGIIRPPFRRNIRKIFKLNPDFHERARTG